MSVSGFAQVENTGPAIFTLDFDVPVAFAVRIEADGTQTPVRLYTTCSQGGCDPAPPTSTHLALTVNMPPLNTPGLRREWEQFLENLASLPAARLPTAPDVERAWNNLQTTSRDLSQSVFRVSAAMGISALASVPSHLQWLSRSVVVAARTTGMVVGGAFMEQYAAASQELTKTGFAVYCAKHHRPYLLAAVRNFLPEKKSGTERLLSQ